MKPLGHKAYGSIPHLPGSRLGPADHHCSPGQARIATERPRDKHDKIIVQEKLDGSCCSVAKVNGELLPLGRSGYIANTSQYVVHQVFYKWAKENEQYFDALLNEGERVCGEFLAQAVGTKYDLPHEPFVPFDIMNGMVRAPYSEFESRCLELGFTIPRLINIGQPYSVELAMEAIKVSGHGALDKVEGVIWRVERRGIVDFLCKFVRHDKEDGKYFPEITGGETVWNMDVSRYL